MDNLLGAWSEFLHGKRSRADVQLFESNLMDNLLALHRSLVDTSYTHDPYEAFAVSDPKPRQIHKASVRDRVLHRAVYRTLYPFFDRLFIHDSYSCRIDKGVHKALNQFTSYARRASHNHRRTVWVLKCDIRKFFASIRQETLLAILAGRIPDARVNGLLGKIIRSFSSTAPGVGLPLGNLTSQLFANVYMNEFDQFVKHTLRVKYYVRYADDFVFLSTDRNWLQELLPMIQDFLSRMLHFELHPHKVELRTVSSGVDFLGWVHFTDHRVLRTVTKRRMLANIDLYSPDEQIASYKGLLGHGNGFQLQKQIDIQKAI